MTDPDPYYKAHVFCCTNVRAEGQSRRSCGRNGASELRSYLKTQAKKQGLLGSRINTSGCLNRCELGPVMVIYPEGVWYSYHNTDDVDEILETHLIGSGRVERLLLKPEDGPKK